MWTFWVRIAWLRQKEDMWSPSMRVGITSKGSIVVGVSISSSDRELAGAKVVHTLELETCDGIKKVISICHVVIIRMGCYGYGEVEIGALVWGCLCFANVTNVGGFEVNRKGIGR